MRTLVHLSDLHFGAVRPEVVPALVAAVQAVSPDLVVISGDLTQRARSSEFAEARAFVDELPGAHLVVPGNHDIPLYNPFRRFIDPLKKYKRYISADLTPEFLDEELLVLGANTARSLTIKGGRVNDVQMSWIRDRFCSVSDAMTKILVTHHPFDGEDIDNGDIVGRARKAMRALTECGADLLLAGHTHIGQTSSTALRYNTGARSALIVQAGTATSSRNRGESNSFNVLQLDPEFVIIDRHQWNEANGQFSSVAKQRFDHSAAGWAAARP